MACCQHPQAQVYVLRACCCVSRCSLFGSDVQDLLDMDRFNTPNSIQVSDPALQLFSDLQQFEPACKLVCSGHEVLLHRWIDQQVR